MAQRIRHGPPRPATKGGATQARVIGPLGLIAEKLLVASAVAAGGAFIYLIYGLAAGHIASFPHPAGSDKTLLSESQQATLMGWVQTATKIISWGAILGTFLALARYYDSSSTIVMSGAIGGFLYLGIPALVTILLNQQYQSANDLTDIIAMGTQAAGKVILVVAAARGAAQVFLTALRRPKRAPIRRAQAAGAQSMRPRSLLRQCWELARCQSPTSVCPSLRERCTCWKRGSGCLCDLKLAEKLASGAEAWTHEEALAVRYRAGAQHRPCRSCPIYEEHQEYKYRLFQWLAYPGTAAGIWAALPLLRLGYDRSLGFLERVMAVLAFTPGRTQPSGAGVQSIVLASNVEWVFIGCLGLLLLSYVLQGIDRAIFKWGW